MTDVRVFKIENQLAKVVKTPGGKTIEQAVQAAEVRIEAVRDTCVAALAEKSEQLAALAAAGRRGEDPKALDGIYDLANAVYGIAGAFDLTPLSHAAFSLCDLADGFRSGEPPNWPAIDVHVDGIRLLATMGPRIGAAGAEAVLDGLKRVRARVLPAG
jgi:chemotaxis protein histidine kinase CheA